MVVENMIYYVAMEEIDFESDRFDDICARDRRYDRKAYAILMEAFRSAAKNGNAESSEIMDEFKETSLDQYGPMTYSVLNSLGVKDCVDIGEMMMNLVESGRIAKGDNDNYEDFRSGYDFKEEFLGPYEAY